MKSAIIGALAITVFVAGCSKNIDTLDAVKQGVLRDIAKNITVGSMDVNVVSVSFRGNEADAIVSFAPKGGPPAMSIPYTLTKQDNAWHISKRGAMQGHATPTAGEIPSGQTQLPPGHPATGAAGGDAGSGTQLPPGHPPLGGKQ